MMNRWGISTFLLLNVCVAISAQSAGQKALLADPRYQRLQKTIDELRNRSAPDSVRKPTVGEGLRQTLQQLYAVEDLLDILKKEADACGHCQPQQGKYEEFEKQTEPLRDTMHSLGIPDRETLGRAVEEYLTHRAPTISEDQADEAERQNAKAYADRHCHALYEPLNRLQALSGAEKQEISKSTKNWFVFAQPWVDRMQACLAQVNPEVLWAQHRYVLIQCFNAHDYDSPRTMWWTLPTNAATWQRCAPSTEPVGRSLRQGGCRAAGLRCLHERKRHSDRILYAGPLHQLLGGAAERAATTSPASAAMSGPGSCANARPAIDDRHIGENVPCEGFETRDRGLLGKARRGRYACVDGRRHHDAPADICPATRR
jgi:hypothetical protein